jgi:hypothetical protein
MQNNYATQVSPVRNTVLFIDGLPVPYKIFRNDIVFFLHPADNPGLDAQPPLIIATRYNNNWQIEDIRDRNLISQVEEDLDLLISEPVLFPC